MFIAFKGMFDTGQAATAAVEWLAALHNSQPAAAIDPEPLFDFQQVRPHVAIGAQGKREIHWPANNLVWAKPPGAAHDLLLLSGIEPNLRWRSFGETIRELVEHTSAEMVVTLGSSPAMVPHSGLFPVRVSTGNPRLASRLGVNAPTYEGPTGLIGSLHQQLADMSAPLLSVQVKLPHYVPGPPSPKATAALLAQIESLLRIPTSHPDLADEIRDWETRVRSALEADDEIRGYVEDLERSLAEHVDDFDGTELADEIDNFLRGLEEG